MKRFLFAFGLWTSILSLFSVGTMKLTGFSPEWASIIKDYAFDLVIVNTMIMTALQGYPAMPDIKLPDGIKRAFVIVAAIGVAGLMTGGAFAADLASPVFKNPFSHPYDPGRCGGYFGINSTFSGTSVDGVGVAPGTQVAQGAIGGTVGYGCPINAANNSFWFGEVLADVTNLNGNTNGLSLSGPASFTERFGVGSPLQALVGSLPGLAVGSNQTPAVPSLPVLPAGVTAGPGAPYMFVALHEQDISAQLGLSQNRQWLISGGVGLGLRYRLSNGVVADTFAEYKTQTNTLCVGPLGSAGCSKIGAGVQAGVQFLY